MLENVVAVAHIYFLFSADKGNTEESRARQLKKTKTSKYQLFLCLGSRYPSIYRLELEKNNTICFVEDGSSNFREEFRKGGQMVKTGQKQITVVQK